MSVQREGPLLETLTRRLAETPPDFLDEPRIGERGSVVVPALVHDLLRMHGARAGRDVLLRFASNDARADRNRLALVQIGCWLLADDWFLGAGCSGEALLARLDGDLAELAAATPAPRFVQDPDRREELARVLLAHLGYRPAGETEAQASDRLSRISGTERQRLLAASRAAEERARAIREALAKKAAEESADKWTRE
jgi:hypothetical protein